MKPEHPLELADEYEIQPLAEPRSPEQLRPLATDSDLALQVSLQSSSAVSAPAPRFSDGFLQERNIKWILGIGTILTLGSSLMLVSSQWSGFSAIFKELIIGARVRHRPLHV